MGTRILVFGAGVIGRIYAGRLSRAGLDVSLVARGAELEALRRDGILLETRSDRSQQAVTVLDASVVAGRWDQVIVALRRDQLDAALPLLSGLDAHTVALLQSVMDHDRVADALGRARVVFGFPGVGGYRTEDGAIRYVELAQQPTTLGRNGGAEEPVRAALATAGFRLAFTDDMPAWMRTHAVFIAAIAGAVLASGGDIGRLAEDRAQLNALVRGVREGFRSLAAQGTSVQPRGLRIIFTRVPRGLAVRYWQAQLRGDVGRVALAPHLKRTADTELAMLREDVRALLADGPPTPTLDRLLVTGV